MRIRTRYNERYPHEVTIIRIAQIAIYDNINGVIDNDPLLNDYIRGGDGEYNTESRRILYKGVCRNFTDTTTDGLGKTSTNMRKLSIPIRFDMWNEMILKGDTIEVTMGVLKEIGIVRDVEPDNNRTLIYWDFKRV